MLYIPVNFIKERVVLLHYFICSFTRNNLHVNVKNFSYAMHLKRTKAEGDS